jgi:hypothetical protein
MSAQSEQSGIEAVQSRVGSSCAGSGLGRTRHNLGHLAPALALELLHLVRAAARPVQPLSDQRGHQPDEGAAPSYSMWGPARAPPRPGNPVPGADYVSWTGLVDRTYSGRHLPPAEDLPHCRSWRASAALRARQRNETLPEEQRALLFLRAVVHRQLPAHRPDRPTQEYIEPRHRSLPDLRPQCGRYRAASQQEGRRIEVAMDQWRGVPVLPLR